MSATVTRLETRAQIRNRHRLPRRPDESAQRSEGQIPERYCPEADWLAPIVIWGNAVERVFWLAVCVCGLTFGVIWGRAIVSAIWG